MALSETLDLKIQDINDEIEFGQLSPEVIFDSNFILPQDSKHISSMQMDLGLKEVLPESPGQLTLKAESTDYLPKFDYTRFRRRQRSMGII